ncbi:MAG: DUF4345 family protein [Gemmatimonadota bacterium]
MWDRCLCRAWSAGDRIADAIRRARRVCARPPTQGDRVLGAVWRAGSRPRLFLLACIRRPRWTRAGLAAQGFSLAGIAVARLAGLVVQGYVDGAMLVALAIEIGGAVLAGLAFREGRYQRYYHLV